MLETKIEIRTAQPIDLSVYLQQERIQHCITQDKIVVFSITTEKLGIMRYHFDFGFQKKEYPKIDPLYWKLPEYEPEKGDFSNTVVQCLFEHSNKFNPGKYSLQDYYFNHRSSAFITYKTLFELEEDTEIYYLGLTARMFLL